MSTLTSHATPSGLTFQVRPAHLVPERLRRPVAAKLIELGQLGEDDDATGVGVTPDEDATSKPQKVTPEELRLSDELNDLLAVALVAEWSRPEPIILESLLDLPKQDYDAIRQVVAPFVNQMLPDFEPTPDEGTPTTP